MQPLGSPSAVSAGTIAIDPERGRFQFAPGGLNAGDRVAVDFAYEDLAAEEQILAGFAERATRLLPAGVTAVVLDSRKAPVRPAAMR